MAVCADLGLATTQVESRSGVWVVERHRARNDVGAALGRLR